MLKIDLKKSSGFPLFSENGELASPDLTVKRKKDFSIDDIKSQLLNKDLSYPKYIYTKYYRLDQEDIFKSKKFVVNAIVTPPNLAGIEYVKTRAIRSSYNRVYEIWYGGGVLVLQNYISSSNDTYIIKLKRDMKIIIPEGYAASLVNTRQSILIVAEIMSLDSKSTPVLDEMKGMAYYVIRKNAKQEIVRNPFYKQVNDYKQFKWGTHVQKYGITLKTPVIKQILRKHDKFKWLFNHTEISLSKD